MFTAFPDALIQLAWDTLYQQKVIDVPWSSQPNENINSMIASNKYVPPESSIKTRRTRSLATRSVKAYGKPANDTSIKPKENKRKSKAPKSIASNLLLPPNGGAHLFHTNDIHAVSEEEVKNPTSNNILCDYPLPILNASEESQAKIQKQPESVDIGLSRTDSDCQNAEYKAIPHSGYENTENTSNPPYVEEVIHPHTPAEQTYTELEKRSIKPKKRKSKPKRSIKSDQSQLSFATSPSDENLKSALNATRPSEAITEVFKHDIQIPIDHSSLSKWEISESDSESRQNISPEKPTGPQTPRALVDFAGAYDCESSPAERTFKSPREKFVSPLSCTLKAKFQHIVSPVRYSPRILSPAKESQSDKNKNCSPSARTDSIMSFVSTEGSPILHSDHIAQLKGGKRKRGSKSEAFRKSANTSTPYISNVKGSGKGSGRTKGVGKKSSTAPLLSAKKLRCL